MYRYLTFLICFLTGSAVLLKRFYLSGVAYDAPIIVDLMFDNLFSLNFIRWEDGIGDSYFKTHTTLIMYFLSWLSYLVPINAVEYCSLIFGLFCGVLGFVSYKMLCKVDYSKPLSLILAILFTFNFYNANTIYLIHFEIFYIVLLCGFFYYFTQKQYNTSYIFLFLLLLSREDFGFHLLTIIISIFMLRVDLDKEFKKRLLYIGLISFISSILLCYIKSFYPGDQAFSRIYFEPSQAGIIAVLKPSHILEGLTRAVPKNIFSIINITCLIIFSVYTRTRIMLVPVLAVLPWIGIHIISNKLYINSLPDYYAFPLAIMLIWPAISILLQKYDQLMTRRVKYLQLLLLIISLFQTIPFYKKLLPTLSAHNIKNMHIFTSEIKHSHNDKQVLTRDVATLNPRIYDDSFIYLRTTKKADEFFYFDQDYTSYKNFLDYKYHYKIENTPVRIATTKPLPTNAYSNMAENKAFWLEALSVSKYFMYKPFALPLELGKIKNLKQKIINFTPGQYCGIIDLTGSDEFTFTVHKEDGTAIFEAKETKFCFEIKISDDYYLTISPASGTISINNLDIKKHDN